MPIEIKDLEYTYSPGTPFEHKALKGVNLTLSTGKVTAIIGQTGSGKSTLVQHLNALLRPTAGTIDIAGFHIDAQTKLTDAKALRKKVGLVFQFPEYQLFVETIAKDIGFGPKNFGYTPEQIEEATRKVLPLVGLDESFLERSPFELSGGQKRRVAIAGILVQDPEVLVLDEPAAGLDPQSADEMMSLFMDLNRTKGKTILLVSHDMEHVLRYCDEVVVMKNGKVSTHMPVHEFFKHPDLLREIDINPPGIVLLKERLMQEGFTIDPDCYSIDELVKQVKAQVNVHE